VNFAQPRSDGARTAGGASRGALDRERRLLVPASQARVHRHSRSTTGRSPSKDTEQLPEPLAGEGAHVPHTEGHASVGVFSVGFQVTILPSMGRTRTALDNAMAECFIVTLKTELIHWRRFPTGR
jgi:transposase InsO family protein